MKNIIEEELNKLLTEKLITLGGKAYPKEGNVVIFAGGSGSGKGFVKNNLLGIEGRVLDTDELKKAYMNSKKLRASLQNDYGLDVDNFDFKNPEDVNRLHILLSAKGVDDNRKNVMIKQVKEAAIKPNLIFDVTLSNLTSFNNISNMIAEMGYDKKNVHLVWVITEYHTAMVNNKNRARVVPDIVFKDIHKGVSRTMQELIQLPNLPNYLDGDVWLVFNNPDTDTTIEKSPNGGKTITNANYVKLKAAGQSIIPYAQIESSIIDKINQYVHKKTKWDKQ